MKKILALLTALVIMGSASIALALPTNTYQVNVLPLTNQRYDLGSTTPNLQWNNLFVKNVTISGTCTGCGGGGGTWPFTTGLTNFGQSVQATTTAEWFQGSPYSLMASGTAQFVFASSTQISATSFCLNGDATPCRTTWPTASGGSGAWPFTTGLSNFGVAVQATTTPEWFQSGLHASSTSQFAYASSTAITAQQFFATSATASSSFNGITATNINLTNASATSTAANGLDLAAGCFSFQGTCLQTLVSSASAYKQAVRYASTSTLPSNTYSNGTGGVGATLTGTALAPFYIDGNTPSVGDRVLVKNESTGANNGIYTVTTLGVSGLTAYVLTRATDYNTNADVFPGVASFTNGGTVNANTCWILTNTSAVTIGTTALTYADECGAGSFTGTYPVMVSGTTISLAFGTTTSNTWAGTQTFTNAPVFTALTGIVQGNGASAATAISNSSTVGQVLRVTGASTYAWGALDLTNSSAVSGLLPFANGGTGVSLSGASQIPYINTGNTALTTSATLNFNGTYMAVGTTTPKFGVLTVGSSTAPEMMFTDNKASDALWAINILSGDFYLASSTALATSSISAFAISNTTGAITSNAGATSTFSSALQSTYINLTGSAATSTAANGINLSKGCFAVGGTCVGAAAAGITSPIASTQTFTSSGTWTKPSGVTLVHVRVVGSGGAGGGCASSGSRHSAAGGGSGAYSEGTTTVSGNVTVTVGAFVAGSSGAVGGNGATSTFAGDRSIAGGGGYGGALAVDGTNVLGGAGGATTTGGYLNIGGQTGSPGIVNGSIGMVSGGTGGSTPLGFGGLSSADATTAQVGVSGTGYGSGGGGCYDNGNNTAMAGGNSGGGIVIVDW